MKHTKTFFTSEDFLPARLFLLPILIFFLLLSNYLRANDYLRFQGDVLFCLAIVCGSGALVGLIFVKLPEKLRFVLLGGLFVFFADVQTHWFAGREIDNWYIWLLAIVVACGLSYCLLRYVEIVLLPFFLFVCVSTLLTPGAAFPPSPSKRKIAKAKPGSKASKLPIWIHVIVDAHVGIDGIRRDFDPKGQLSRRLENDYVSRQFRVFPKAYSTFNFTNNALRSLFTFTADPKKSNRSYIVQPKSNRYFQLLKKRGYKLHVLQSDRVELCKSRRGKGALLSGEPAHCWTYPHQDLRTLNTYPLNVLQKASFLMGQSMQLARSTTRMHGLWNKLFGNVWDGALKWGRSTIPLVGIDVLRWAEHELVNAKPGDAFLIHTITPHSPFAFDATCKLLSSRRPRPGESVFQSRYRLYLQQLGCVHKRLLSLFAKLKAAGLYKNAVLIVHGDHGSRVAPDDLVATLPPVDKIRSSSYIDHFSTLFAVKPAGATTGRSINAVRPLHQLLSMLMKDGKYPAQLADIAKPEIVLFPFHGPKRRALLPPFPKRPPQR